MFKSLLRRLAPISAIVILLAAAGVHAQGGDDLAALNRQVEALFDAGKYAEALPLAERAVKVAEERQSPDSPVVVDALLLLAELYQSQGRDPDAEHLLQRVRISLDMLAFRYESQRRYADAEALRRRGLTILEKVLGPSHPNVGRSLKLLAWLYYLQGRYPETEALFKRCIAIYEKTYGSDHNSLGTAISDLRRE
jgi:tetratricopeptide (TPR) repeat protein